MANESQENDVVIQTSTATVDYASLAPEQQLDIESEIDTSEQDAQVEPELSEEDELLKLLEDNDEGADSETEEPETEDKEDDDFEVKFEQHFEKTFGMKPEDAVALVQELVQERVDREVRGQLMELKQAWGTDDNETQQRLEAVREVYNSLSPENQAKFNNVKGAQVIWTRIQASGKAPKVLRGKSSTPSKSKPQAMYTQKQIDAMSIKEYEQNAQRIAYAYANGLVVKG